MGIASLGKENAAKEPRLMRTEFSAYRRVRYQLKKRETAVRRYAHNT